MSKYHHIFLITILYLIIPGKILKSQENVGPEHVQIISNNLFNSNQKINIVRLEKAEMDSFVIDIAYSGTLIKTSDFAKTSNAEMAINGGFFNIKEGFSVSYIEHKDSVVALTVNEKNKRNNPENVLNASFIIENEGDVSIEFEKWDSLYIESVKEYGVLGAGPLLLLGSKKVPIFEKSFSINRHPRTCICETEEEILFFTIDGRSQEAAGMSLYELQDFLLGFHCIDALNMDGGGSTTMWLKEKGVVNNPSDMTGERKVANAILIKKIK